MTLSRTLFLFLLFWHFTNAQKQFTVKGNFPEVLHKEILLKGYTMAGDSLLATTTTDYKGSFSIAYPSSYIGAALVEIKDTKSVIVLLNHENFEMQWDNLEQFKTLSFKDSPENLAFANGIAVAQKSESLLTGLTYLKPIYEQGLPLALQKVEWVTAEITLQRKAFPEFLKSLPANSYASYYLNLRKLLQDMPITANNNAARMPMHEIAFNNMDFADKRLVQSGLYKELLDGYFLLMESYGAMEDVYFHANASTDALLKSLDKNPILKQDVAEYLFRLFEKRSLIQAAEHLALAMLNNQNCEMDTKHEAMFEQYRKMAKGNIAPEILFENATKPMAKLSAITNQFKLVVFGASWCTKCQEEIPTLKPYYNDWKTKYDLEMVFVCLDTEKESFNAFTKELPWLSSCDYKGWDSKAAVDYCVFGTPTMYLLDTNNKILFKPISIDHLKACLEFLNPEKK
jgi:thiol-disulfide isomerase/thioredoxin